jgi:hypothetical protein
MIATAILSTSIPVRLRGSASPDGRLIAVVRVEVLVVDARRLTSDCPNVAWRRHVGDALRRAGPAVDRFVTVRPSANRRVARWRRSWLRQTVNPIPISLWNSRQRTRGSAM